MCCWPSARGMAFLSNAFALRWSISVKSVAIYIFWLTVIFTMTGVIYF